MALPKDPFILLSVVNTQLRDRYGSVEALCDDLGEDAAALTETLRAAGFTYDAAQHQFK